MGSLDSSAAQLTQILQDWSAGNQSALDRLTPLVYAELHRIAEFRMKREQQGHVLQPSALVNEAFLRLVTSSPVAWKNRTHFFAHAASIMRHVLVDFARKQQILRTDLSTFSDPCAKEPARAEFLDIDAAVTELSQLDSRQAKIVEMRYYGGLSVPEVAAVMEISEATVNREWQTARAWLFRRLRPKPRP